MESVNDLKRDMILLEKHIRRVLETESRNLLSEIAGQTMASRDEQRKGIKWHVMISSDRPLIFKPAEIDNRLQPDIFCEIAGPGSTGWAVKKQNIILRIWSLNERLSFRSGLDSEVIHEQLRTKSYRRVMVRVHFDKAEEKERCVHYHLQFGGIPTKDEFLWYPKGIEVPRIPFPPMDLVLACELVIANFFPDFFDKLNNEPEWVSLVSRAQNYVLGQYYMLCHSTCSLQGSLSRQTLLHRLYNPYSTNKNGENALRGYPTYG